MPPPSLESSSPGRTLIDNLTAYSTSARTAIPLSSLDAAHYSLCSGQISYHANEAKTQDPVLLVDDDCRWGPGCQSRDSARRDPKSSIFAAASAERSMHGPQTPLPKFSNRVREAARSRPTNLHQSLLRSQGRGSRQRRNPLIAWLPRDILRQKDGKGRSQNC